MKFINREDKIGLLIVALITMPVIYFWFTSDDAEMSTRLVEGNYAITQTWKMPTELNEISGIAWIADGKLACVQDEEGKIFIYDLNENKIEKTIDFAKTGDYEGISIVDSTAYILRSDGTLFEIQNYLKNDAEVTTYDTPFTEENDMESLTHDKENNRLLLIPKEKDLKNEALLGVYTFNLESKQMDSNPILKVEFNDPIFENNKEATDKKSSNAIHPSDIAMNPLDGNYYIVDGKQPKLLVLNTTGKSIKLLNLDKKSFSQPEGITFSPEGTMYISNEGKKGTATILEVELEE